MLDMGIDKFTKKNHVSGIAMFVGICRKCVSVASRDCLLVGTVDSASLAPTAVSFISTCARTRKDFSMMESKGYLYLDSENTRFGYLEILQISSV